MKSFKQYSIDEATMTDYELAVYPDKVKFDKDGNVSSYSLIMKMEGGKKTTVIKDAKLERAIISFLGDADIKTSLAVSPKAGVYDVEVYQDEKGMYVELGSKKVYFKG